MASGDSAGNHSLALASAGQRWPTLVGSAAVIVTASARQRSPSINKFLHWQVLAVCWPSLVGPAVVSVTASARQRSKSIFEYIDQTIFYHDRLITYSNTLDLPPPFKLIRCLSRRLHLSASVSCTAPLGKRTREACANMAPFDDDTDWGGQTRCGTHRGRRRTQKT